MLNHEYERRYKARFLLKQFRFAPCPRLSDAEFRYLMAALGALRVCPRLPRLGEAVLWRDLAPALAAIEAGDATAAPWARQVVALEHQRDGETVFVTLDNGVECRRALYRTTWVFAPGHPLADRKDD